MKKSGLWKMVCVVCVFCAASVIASPAQTLTTIYNFTGANGSHPYAGLLLAGDGNFYGTTVQGGPHGAGSVFKITPSGTLTTLHSFNGSDGLNPYAGLVLGNDGNFYGTTNNGGYHSIGEGFKITPGVHPICPIMLGDAVLAARRVRIPIILLAARQEPAPLEKPQRRRAGTAML